MLQFWKKNGLRNGNNSNKSSPSKLTEPPNYTLSNGVISEESLQVGPLSGYNDSELGVGDLGEPEGTLKVSSSHSRLSKNLAEVLADKSALGYFIQYLESRGYVALIKFWLDAESFRAASSAEIRCAMDTPDVTITREILEAECTSGRHSPQHEYDISVEKDCTLSITCSEASDNSALEHSHSSIAGNTVSLGISQSTNYEIVSSSEMSSINLRSALKACRETSSDITLVANSKVSHKFPNVETCNLQNSDPPSRTDANCEIRQERNSQKTTNRTCGTVSPVQISSPTRAVKLIEATLHDAVRIFRKYFIHGARYRIRVPEEVRNRMISAICKESGAISTDSFSECQDLVFRIMEKDFFNDFLRSDYHCKHQIDVLTSGNILLTDILYNDNALFYFTEFMEQEGHRSLVEFWLAAVNFRQHLLEMKGIYDTSEAQNDAIILYDKYFSLQATCPLGFSDSIRFEIEHNICREDGPLPDCFEKPVRIVLYVLEKNYLQPFLSSQLFFNYLSELISTIQSSSSLLSYRKSGSECSSELSLSAQNTLLATEDSSSTPRRIICKLDDRQMSIDSRQLYDPDSLWRRKRPRDLSFGRITGLGRYESDVEPEPDRKEKFRFARAVKKLVNMEEDKAKEELAWQVAEMIVKDVTTLTMGSDGD